MQFNPRIQTCILNVVCVNHCRKAQPSMTMNLLKIIHVNAAVEDSIEMFIR